MKGAKRYGEGTLLSPAAGRKKDFKPRSAADLTPSLRGMPQA